jgi:hypothetical protein
MVFGKAASSSSWYRLDNILDTLLPRFYEAESRKMDYGSNGRMVHDHDHEIDDIREDMYESALADSEFAQWLNYPAPAPSVPNDTALERLRMLVKHFGTSFVSRPTTQYSSRNKGKGPSDAEHWRNAHYRRNGKCLLTQRWQDFPSQSDTKPTRGLLWLMEIN